MRREKLWRSLLAMTTCVFVLGTTPVYAQDVTNLESKAEMGEKEGDFLIQDKVLLKYSGTDAEVVVPDGVTEIGINAFSDNYSNPNQYLKKVTLPDSVEKIDKQAFSDCIQLDEMIIPKSVTYIGMGAFSNTPWLKKQTREDGMAIVNGILVHVNESQKRQEITVPEGVTTIGENVFSLFYSPSKIHLPDSLTTIEDNAFRECYNLREIEIPDSVVRIGKSAFYRCENLSKVKLPGNITKIEDAAFYDCGLGELHLPESVTEIGASAFAECPFSEVTIPNSVVSIGSGAFDSQNLQKIVIPESVTEIGAGAFYQMKRPGGGVTPGKYPIIYGKTGSCAQQYAEKNKISFQDMEQKEAPVQTSDQSGSSVASDETKKPSQPEKQSPTVKLSKQKLTALKSKKKKQLTVMWKKNSQASGYEFQYSKDKKFKKAVKKINIKKNKVLSVSLPKLSSGKRYYVRVRSYKTITSNEKTIRLYGAWSSVKSKVVK